MPSQIAHCIAAEEALLIADPALGAAWGLDRSVRGAAQGQEGSPDTPSAWFRLGAQGPDIFYHNQRTKPSGIHYGALAHRRNYGLIIEGALGALVESGLETESPESAWLLGFATHAALDRAAHPYIVFFSGWHSPLEPDTARLRGCHPFLERFLDLAILEDERSLTIGSVDLEGLLPLDGRLMKDGTGPAASVERNVIGILSQGLRAAFPRAAAADFLMERRIANAFSDARYFYRVTNPSRINAGNRGLLPHFDDRARARSIALIHPESLPPEVDVANRRHVAWLHPADDGRGSSDGFRELFHTGVQDGAEALRVLLGSLHARSIAPGFSAAIGNGGLSITDADGIAIPPRICRPLPLPELMELEFARRLDQARNLAAQDPARPEGPR